MSTIISGEMLVAIEKSIGHNAKARYHVGGQAQYQPWNELRGAEYHRDHVTGHYPSLSVTAQPEGIPSPCHIQINIMPHEPFHHVAERAVRDMIRFIRGQFFNRVTWES